MTVCSLPPLRRSISLWVYLLLVGWVFLQAGLFPTRAGILKFSTIVTNGPATNRINLVLFSEGYTSNELAQFLIDATNAANDFFSVEPYTEYSNFFNVFAIATNSANSGSTHLDESDFVVGDTAFNSSYDALYGFFITIPPNSVDANNNDGQGKINALLKQFLPATNNDLPVLLVNDPVYGGSDNYGTTAISSTSFISYILVHESGHTLGKLGDEYSTAYPGYTSVEKPNCTTNTNYLTLKWNAWVATNTPIPTIGYASNLSTVGVYQGANYHTNGWYRPFYNCCMESFDGGGFCPVCTEALVLAIYGKDRPIDGLVPATNNLTNASGQMLTFSVNLLQPVIHNLDIQWLTNKVAVPDATNTVFNIWPSQLGNGTQKVEADVWDPTPMVRTDTNSLLKQTNIWTLALIVPAIKISQAEWLTNGNFTLQVTGAAPSGVVIQYSTNLMQWTPLLTNFFTNGIINFTNAGARTNAHDFYRVETPP
jgi:hypothetical protein